MLSSVPQLIVGVFIAVAVFVLQEVVRWIVDGALFRRRLVADIKNVVNNFRSWHPPPQVQIQPTPEGAQPEVTVAPIWDYGYEVLGDVYSHSSSLMPDLFIRAINVYTACGRFDEIRCAYNKAILHMIGASDKRAWTAVLNGQLKDMALVAEEIIREGCALLDSMQECYSFENAMDELVVRTRMSGV